MTFSLLQQVGIVAFSVTTTIVLWEHFARISGFVYKPSWFIHQAKNLIDYILQRFGCAFAWVSSVFEWLRLDELLISIGELYSAISSLILVSMTSAFLGYKNAILQYSWKPYVVFGGSCVLLGIIFFVINFFLNPTKLLESLAQKCIEWHFNNRQTYKLIWICLPILFVFVIFVLMHNIDRLSRFFRWFFTGTVPIQRKTSQSQLPNTTKGQEDEDEFEEDQNNVAAASSSQADKKTS